MSEREVFTWPYPSPFAALVIESIVFIVGGYVVSRTYSWFGIFLVLIGVGVIAVSFAVETCCTIICTTADFTVVTKKRLGKPRRTGYRWSDVRETRYRETGRDGLGVSIRRYFAVITDDGSIFEMSTYQRGDFAGLIAIFNRMTPHLPYTWQPQGPGSTRLWRYGFDRYGKIPRETNREMQSGSAMDVSTLDIL